MSPLSSDDAAAFARVTRDLLAEPKLDLTLQRVVDLAVQTIPGCDFAGISLRHGDKVETPAATAPLVDQLDQAQYDLQEGPCLDAIWVEDIYRINDTSHEDRWPNWAPKAAAAGIRSTLSVRLATEKDIVGGLNMYSTRVSGFDDEAIVTAHIYATHASSALAMVREVDGLQTALHTRHAIGVAQGLLMYRYGLDQESSFQVMRRLSSHQNLKLRDIAARVLKEFSDTGTLS
jgi:GAF domain-containing protein